jgi:predicted porin
MNKNIKLAVAGAVLALSASANAGIIIPAGDWTLDIGGNVNAYTTWSKADGTATINSSFAQVGTGQNTTNGWGNGLLPNFLSVSGSTRQNDLDVGFTISLQPGTANSAALTAVGSGGNGGLNNRQSFITFGDKSWGSIKMGKDLGIYGSDAILSDMTLLGVGALTPAGNTTLGRIGFGNTYADWKPQFSYTTPNMGGFQATAGIAKHFTDTSVMSNTATTTITGDGTNPAPTYEAKASYSFSANDLTGKVWVGGIASNTGSFVGFANSDKTAYGGEIGANVNVAGFALTGYYYDQKGIGHMGQGLDGYGLAAAGRVEARDQDGGYIQATYALPTKTKLGVSWGISNLDKASGESITIGAARGEVGTLVKENEMTTVGLYHPLTKHLNLVTEYNHQTSKNQADQENKAKAASVGAILFF